MESSPIQNGREICFNCGAGISKYGTLLPKRCTSKDWWKGENQMTEEKIEKKLEEETFANLNCPNCGNNKLKDVGYGVFRCRECDFQFEVSDDDEEHHKHNFEKWIKCMECGLLVKEKNKKQWKKGEKQHTGLRK